MRVIYRSPLAGAIATSLSSQMSGETHPPFDQLGDLLHSLLSPLYVKAETMEERNSK